MHIINIIMCYARLINFIINFIINFKLDYNYHQFTLNFKFCVGLKKLYSNL